MPKYVNHHQRRQHIIQAAIRLIVAGDIRSISIRTVACEAAMKQSTLRHYFATYDEMLKAVFLYVRNRQRLRVEQTMKCDSVQNLVAGLMETLPIDDQRREEAVIWLALCASKRTETISNIIKEMNNDLNHLCEYIIQRASGGEIDIVAARALRGIIDGLAICMMNDPTDITPEIVEAVLWRYVSTLR